MSRNNKFEIEEKLLIENLLSTIYPNDLDIINSLREGIPPAEPDGIFLVNNQEIGIEVTDFLDDDSLQREKAINKIHKYFNEKLKELNSEFKIDFSGNEMPIHKVEQERFKKETMEMLNEINLKDDFPSKIIVKGVEIKLEKYSNICQQRCGIYTNYELLKNSYYNAIIEAIKRKKLNKYCTKITYLLLHDKVNHSNNFECDFEKLSKELTEQIENHNFNTKFEKIFISCIGSRKYGGFVNPEAIQIYPTFQVFFNKNTTRAYQEMEKMLKLENKEKENLKNPSL